MDPHIVVELGIMRLRDYVSAAYVSQTIVVYNQALVDIFRVAFVVFCLTVLGAAGMEWKSMRGAKKQVDSELDSREVPTTQ